MFWRKEKSWGEELLDWDAAKNTKQIEKNSTSLNFFSAV